MVHRSLIIEVRKESKRFHSKIRVEDELEIQVRLPRVEVCAREKKNSRALEKREERQNHSDGKQ
ncbi:hypothetical protein MA16_Dca009480 [Dendrobium catenatum]|uniref:Uncharacterized protein n=1 Tax=Dendrobium catenatum TaxID=906689 RepID=A0A2I0X510_9ASPA|nr:hypothetical protein MA16_Dca009480 [Dendrobium catenatum]